MKSRNFPNDTSKAHFYGLSFILYFQSVKKVSLRSSKCSAFVFYIPLFKGLLLFRPDFFFLFQKDPSTLKFSRNINKG